MSNVRVILVRTHYPGNIGSVARVMANFGLTDLVLVDPIADDKSHEARMLAAGGVEILDSLRILSFEEAVADCTFVLATAGLTQGLHRETILGSPADLMPKFAATPGPKTIVFGPEPHGLTTDEISRAHALLTLPCASQYTSFNLAMAAGLVLYELHQAQQVPRSLIRPPAPFAQTQRAVDHLEESLRAISFLFGQNADHLMHGVRHLILRANPTAEETGILHGLARQLEFIGRQWKAVTEQ